MSDTTSVPKPLTAEQLQKISGAGECTASELMIMTENLIQAYDNLVDFTSHVIERVAGD